MKFRGLFTSCILFTLLLSCSSGNDTPNDKEEIPIPEAPVTFYYGADLSYVNEMEDCGASYKDANSAAKDPYAIFKEAGTNLIRIRLWHNPTWTNYSNYSCSR